MNKRLILFFATAFGAIGGYLPTLFGDTQILDGWTILGGFIGGLFGVWFGAYVSKRWG
jgi:uncharacterized membrane protein YfcA